MATLRGGVDSNFDLVKPQQYWGTAYISPRLAKPKPSDRQVAWTGEKMEYTRFEKARIVGARALQLSMGAPPLIETDEEERDPVAIAMMEYDADAIPLTVQRVKGA